MIESPKIGCVQHDCDECQQLRALNTELDAACARLEALNAELVEALRGIVHAAKVHACHHALSVDGQKFYDIAEAALAKVEAGK